MTFERTSLAGAFLVGFDPLEDDRGSLSRVFDIDEFAAHGLETSYPQHTVVVNKRENMLRGLHFQAEPFGEAKLVRCSVGTIFDAIVDIRPSSPTFRRWFGTYLGNGGTTMLYVPSGFAHGYLTISTRSEVHYLISHRYVPDATRGFRYDDPSIAIAWPHAEPTMSERDRSLPSLDDALAT